MPEQVRVRGRLFRSAFGVIDRQYGAGAADRVVSHLCDDARAAWGERRIVPGGWYPSHWYEGLHTGMQKLWGGGPATARALGRGVTKLDTEGVFGFVLLLVSTEVLLRSVPRVWGNYFDGGVLEVAVPRPKCATLRARDAHGVSRMMWEEACGGFSYLMERSGATKVSVEGPYITAPGEALVEAYWS